MAHAQISDHNWTYIKDYIVASTTQVNDHVLWTSNQQNIGRDNFFHSHIKRKDLICADRVRRPHVWWYMMTHKTFVPETYRLVSTCDTDACIAHCDIVPKIVNTVFKMEPVEYEQTLRRLQHYFAPADSSGCIRWLGAYLDDGYGAFTISSNPPVYRAHVASWMLANKSNMPDGCVVRHVGCNNSWCVNHNHLDIGTVLENSQDKATQGTQRYGEKVSSATITNKKARLIIESFGNGQTQPERAKLFDVSERIIKHIDSGESWTWLMTPEEICKRKQHARGRNLSREEVQQISESKGRGTVKERATRFKVSLHVIYDIDKGEHQFLRSPVDQTTKQQRHVEKLKNCIRSRSASFLGDDQKTHWLWDNNQTTTFAKRPRMKWNGKQHFVHAISYSIFNGLSEVPEGNIRHKCQYKYCVAPDCLELWTYETDASNGKKRLMRNEFVVDKRRKIE